MPVPILIEKARNLRMKGEFYEALEVLDSYRNTLESHQRSEIIQCLNEESQCLFRSGKNVKAEEKSQKALKLAEKIPIDKKGIADAFNNLGSIYCNKGELDKGDEFYKKSLILREEIGDQIDIAASLNNIGTLYTLRGELGHAEEYYLRCLTLKETINVSDWSIATTLNNLGIVLWKKGNLTKAQSSFHRCIDLYEKAGGNPQSLAEAYYNLVHVLLLQDALEEAMIQVEKLLNLSRINLSDIVAKACIAAGLLELKRCNLQLALDYGEKAIPLAASIPLFTIAIEAMYLVAQALLQLYILTKHHSHRAHLEAVLIEVEELSKREKLHATYAEILLIRGFLERSLFNFEKAITYFENAKSESDEYGLQPLVERANRELKLLHEQKSMLNRFQEISPNAYEIIQLQELVTYFQANQQRLY